jgi:hypothetical protein
LTTAGVASLNTKATNILGTGATVINRVVFPTSGSPLPFTANNFRSIIPTSATTFYASGAGSSSTGGIWYYNGTSYTQVSTTQTNTRNVEIFNGNLYYSTGSGTTGIYQVGTGLPTTSGQTATLIAAATSPYGFSMSPDGNTMYVADDGTVNGNTGGGIQKWTKSGSTWTRQYTFAVQTRGITVDYSGNNPIIYATTIATLDNNKLIKITDTGSSATSSDVILAGSNYVFRGVDFAPAAAPSAPTIGTLTQTTCASATGSVELTGLPSGQWRIYGFPSGSAVGTGSSTTISGLAAGTYTFIVTSYTGRTSSSSASATISAQPGAPGYPTAPTAASQSFCENLSPSVANLETTNGSDIQWYSASTGGSALPTTDLLANGNYYATQSVSACESQTRTLSAVTLNTINTASAPANGDVVWHGTSSSNWNTASNWSVHDGTTYSLSTAVPTDLTNVIIVPANQTCVLAQPSVLTATANAAKNVLIESGATLSLSGGTLSVAGDWTNNGTFTGSTGTVSFNGTGTVTLGGTSSTSFTNLTMDKTGSVSLSTPVAVSGSLTLNNGIINLGANNLTLGSATVSGGSSTSYVKTASTGVLKRNVGTSAAVVFPVGNSAYNPAELTNTIGSDIFSVRVVDAVYVNGTSGTLQSTEVVNRTWMIEEAVVGGNSVKVKLNWNGVGEEATNFTSSSAFVAHYVSTSGMWDNLGGTVNSGSVESSQAVSSFSPFTISSSPTFAPLPVELLSFDAQCAGENVIVSWKTASEHYSLNFIVERSENGSTWSEIQTQAAAGNSNTVLSYAIEDAGAARGINYYRLIQTDQDGVQKIYGAILSNCGSDENFFMSFPNPSDAEITIVFNDKKINGSTTLMVRDAHGRVVRSITLEIQPGTNSILIPDMELEPAVYYLQLEGDNFTSPVIKHSLR